MTDSEPDERTANTDRAPFATTVGEKPVVRLKGCGPTPLADYLKALGVLRLVAEQADPEARGWWEGDIFWLRSLFDGNGLENFFLKQYEPTPIVAPWNGGSGFYPKDNTSGILPIEAGGASRFAPLRRTIHDVRRILTESAVAEKPDSNRKHDLLIQLRSEIDEAALAWMDAAVLLTDESPRYPPLLGTGGNDGRLEFTNNYLQRLVDLIDPDTGQARETAGPLLAEALFARPAPHLERSAIGQFSPADAGGPNAASSFEGSALVNAWDFVLMLEGAILFAAAATRRLEAARSNLLSYPFTVRTVGAGSGAAGVTDESSSRGEMWMPIWKRPAKLVEVRTLLGEGRATVADRMRRRTARDGLDFARAVATLGVARGIDEFQRFAFLQRYGRTYLATPLNRVPVRRNPKAELIDQLERRNWLGRFRRLGRRKEAPARVASLARRLDEALFHLALHGSPQRVQETLSVLGEVMRYFAASAGARERCGPVPLLDENWIAEAEDGTLEFRVALALAGLHARRRSHDGTSSAQLPMVIHVAPVASGRHRSWNEDAQHDVVWGARSLEQNLRQVLERRLLVAQREETIDRPLAGWVTVPADAAAAWLAGRLDSHRIHRLLLGLVLTRVPRRTAAHHTGRGTASPLPGAYRLLKPLFSTATQLQRIGFLDDRQSLPLSADIVRYLGSNRVDDALARGGMLLRTRGFPAPKHLAPQFPDGLRLLAALMLPIQDGDLRRILEPFRTQTVAGQNISNRENDHGA